MSALGEGATAQPPHILVVDDEEDNRELVQIILQHDGYVVRTADGGATALASLAEHVPDLVLVDLMMPDMDGYEVTARIKRNAATKHVVVVMFSALCGKDVLARARAAGAEDVFAKPMGGAELCARLRLHMPAARTTRQAT